MTIYGINPMTYLRSDAQTRWVLHKIAEAAEEEARERDARLAHDIRNQIAEMLNG